MKVIVAEMARHELELAAGVLGRAYRDAPLSRAIYGDDPIQRLKAVGRVMGQRVSTMRQPPLVARNGDVIVGVCGLAPPDSCRLSVSQRRQITSALVSGRSRSTMMTIQMMTGWEKHHPEERHWHLGPVAVEPSLHGMGVGSQMMDRFCVLVDADGEMAWLETDKPENVGFFERFGFVTLVEDDVIGVPNWFMRRRPKADRSG